MKKHLYAILCSLVLICWTSGALASTSTIDLSYAFTSDNYVTSFSLIGPGGVVQDFGAKNSNWWEPLSGSYTGLLAGTTYTLQWDVANAGGANPSSADPMAFLGQFSVNGVKYLSGLGDMWAVSTKTAEAVPTLYGALGGTNIWSNNKSNLASLLSPIDPTAQWIGFGAYPGITSLMTVSASFTTAPVPLPGAALLLGSAILGMVGIRRRQLV